MIAAMQWVAFAALFTFAGFTLLELASLAGAWISRRSWAPETPQRLAPALEQRFPDLRRRVQDLAVPVNDGPGKVRREQHRPLVQTAMTGRGLDRFRLGRPSWLSRCFLHRGEHAAPAAAEQP